MCQVISEEIKKGLFFWLKKKTKLFFFLCLPPLSGGLILLNFNIWSSNRCILELCTPWTKTEPHPQQLFNWQISSLSLAYKNTQTTTGNVCFMLKFCFNIPTFRIKCIYIYQTKVRVGYKLRFEVFVVYIHLYFWSKTEIIFSVAKYLRSWCPYCPAEGATSPGWEHFYIYF